MKMVVAILLASSLGTEGIRIAPEIIANVSMLLARHHEVDCVQIFRTENLTLSKVEAIHRMWKVLAVVEAKVTTGVYSYKRYLEKKKLRPRKVSCYRSLKILSDDEESKIGYAEFSTKFSIKDAIWVLYTDSLSVRFFQDAKVVFNDVIIVAVMVSQDMVSLHEVYRINQNYPLKILSLGNWTRAEGLRIDNQSMYDRKSDLEGIVLRTASVQSWPASYFRNGKWQGFLIKLWDQIQTLINCTSVDIKAENTVGMKLDNGSWNGLVGMALRNEIDVLVTEVVIDKDRSHALDFLHPITKSRFQIYTRHLGYQWQWASILKPFHVSVWTAIVAWVFVATLSWTFIHHVCHSQGLGSMNFGKFAPLKGFFLATQALCQQGYHHSPNSFACRIMFFVSYAVSSVLIPSYSASLVSFLAQKIHLKSFDSLQEMVADGTYRLIVKENTAQHAFFVHSKDDFHKLAYEKLVKPVPENIRKFGVRQSIMALCHLDNYAVMGVEDVIDGRLHHIATLDCPIVHLTNPVSTIYLTMATAKNNPFWGLINHHLGKLLNTGVAERLRRTEFPIESDSHCTDFVKGTEVEVGMRQVVSAFVLIGSFAVVSVLLLLLEIHHLYHKTNKSKLQRKKRSLYFSRCKNSFHFEMTNQKFRSFQTQAKVITFRDFYWD